MTDIQIRDEGTLVLLTPATTAGRDWCAEWLGDDCPRFGAAYVVEHRYAADILDGMTDDGLTVAA